jgi:hypothetical protein
MRILTCNFAFPDTPLREAARRHNPAAGTDDRVPETAPASGAEIIVSGDRHLPNLGARRGDGTEKRG